MSALHRAELRVAYMRKPFGDCIRDHSRAEGHRAVRRLSRAIVANESAAFVHDSDDERYAIYEDDRCDCEGCVELDAEARAA